MEIETIEMHTAGEPVRIVVRGLPPILGQNLLEKRQYCRTHLDYIRTRLMFEPRGHHEMYGVYILDADLPSADFAVLFLHNEGYSTMCGHATIAVARWAVESGRVVRSQSGETRVVLQCPCGLVTALVQADGSARFESVPSFAFALDQEVIIKGQTVVLDVAFGGAFYAILPAAAFGLDLLQTPTSRLVEVAHAITVAVQEQVRIEHPFEQDLSFLYGTILTDDQDGSNSPSVNVCVFADKQVDRSPTGSGVQARLALQVARAKRDGLFESTNRFHRQFESLTHQVFTGEVDSHQHFGPHEAVVVLVAGKGYFTGRCVFTVESDDPLKDGFLLH